MQGLVRELIDFNLRRGSPQVRVEVRTLLCILTKDNPRATDEMNSLLMTRIGAAIRGHLSNPELVSLLAWFGNITVARMQLWKSSGSVI